MTNQLLVRTNFCIESIIIYLSEAEYQGPSCSRVTKSDRFVRAMLPSLIYASTYESSPRTLPFLAMPTLQGLLRTGELNSANTLQHMGAGL